MVHMVGKWWFVATAVVVLAVSVVSGIPVASSTAGSDLALVIQAEDGKPINEDFEKPPAPAII